MNRFRLGIIVALILLFSSHASSKPRPRNPTPTISPEDVQCNAAIAKCKTSIYYQRCLLEHHCVLPKPGTNPGDSCIIAMPKCEKALNECVETIGPVGCHTEGYVVPSPLPSPLAPTPFPSSSPSPSPTPINLECVLAIKKCEKGNFQECIMSEGCRDIFSVSEICKQAREICRGFLAECLILIQKEECV